jgi:hypothetical protein
MTVTEWNNVFWDVMLCSLIKIFHDWGLAGGGGPAICIVVVEIDEACASKTN